jgi:hypothetical protein
MSYESLDHRVCGFCETTIYNDKCRCDDWDAEGLESDEELEELGMKLYDKLVIADRRTEAALMAEGHREAERDELLLEVQDIAMGRSNVPARPEHLTALFEEGVRLRDLR